MVILISDQNVITVFTIETAFNQNVIDFSQLTRKRAREEEIEAAEKAKREREWQKNFEVCSPMTLVTYLQKNPIMLLLLAFLK